MGNFEVFLLDLGAKRVASAPGCGDVCAACPGERIQDGIARKREHPDRPFSQGDREWRGMTTSGGDAFDVCPYWPPPILHLAFGQHRQRLL